MWYMPALPAYRIVFQAVQMCKQKYVFFMFYMNVKVEMLNNLCDVENIGALIKKKWFDHDVTSSAIVELLQMRSGVMESFLNMGEVSFLIDQLCVSKFISISFFFSAL